MTIKRWIKYSWSTLHIAVDAEFGGTRMIHADIPTIILSANGGRRKRQREKHCPDDSMLAYCYMHWCTIDLATLATSCLANGRLAPVHFADFIAAHHRPSFIHIYCAIPICIHIMYIIYMYIHSFGTIFWAMHRLCTVYRHTYIYQNIHLSCYEHV